MKLTLRQRRSTPALTLMLAPSILLLGVWMIVPLFMTLYFSVRSYSLMREGESKFIGFQNYYYLFLDPAFLRSLFNSAVILGGVLVITVSLGALLAWLYDHEFAGRKVARVLIIAPFFVMPTVNALLWKDLMMHPIYGLLAGISRVFHLQAFDWFGRAPLLSIVILLSWQWLPFAFLILLTAMQSLNPEQLEAAAIEGAGPWQTFWYQVLPHLRRPIGAVIMIEAIFLLSVFAEIFATTGGGPGVATTNLTYLVYSLGLLQFDVGMASAGGIVAVTLANIVAIFLMRYTTPTLRSA
jgi:sorbitol/mannitol transport system permease protein